MTEAPKINPAYNTPEYRQLDRFVEKVQRNLLDVIDSKKEVTARALAAERRLRNAIIVIVVLCGVVLYLMVKP